MNSSLPNVFPPHVDRLAAACLLVALGTAPALGAASLTSTAELNAGKARIDAELRANRTICSKLYGNSRDVCRERARGKELVAKAEMDLAHTGTRKSQDKLMMVRLDTAYDLARTQCNDKAGTAKIACTKEAQAVRAKGQADLKLRQHAIAARHDAQNKLAAEKCDEMAADARVACLAAAQAKAGKH